MKRKISFAILTMITFLFMFNGCSSNAYSVKICGYSDSVPEIKTDLEYSKWTQGSYEDKNQPVSVELKIRNENILGQYTDSRILTYNYYPTHTYKINYNNYFSIDPDKKLTSYFWGQSETSVPSDDLSENDYIKIAQDFLSQIIDLQDYRISIKYIENYELYRIYFTKYIGELKTADEATVEVDRAGNLYSYSVFRQIQKLILISTKSTKSSIADWTD